MRSWFGAVVLALSPLCLVACGGGGGSGTGGSGGAAGPAGAGGAATGGRATTGTRTGSGAGEGTASTSSGATGGAGGAGASSTSASTGGAGPGATTGASTGAGQCMTAGAGGAGGNTTVTWQCGCWYTYQGQRYQAMEFDLQTDQPVPLEGTLFFDNVCDASNGTDNLNDTGGTMGSGSWLFWFIHHPGENPTSADWWIGSSHSGCIDYTVAPDCP